MAKRGDAALSGEEMLELYYKNKEDKSFNNRDNLRILVAYLSEMVASGVMSDTDALKYCSEKLFDIEEHKEPDERKLCLKLRTVGIIISCIVGASVVTAAVCNALGLDFIFNIFTHEGETTILNVAEQYTGETTAADETTMSESVSETDENVAETESAGGSIATVDELIAICEPGWLPEGYELVETVLDDDTEYSRGHMVYENDSGGKIRLFVSEKDAGMCYFTYNDAEYYESYEYGGVIHKFYSDNGYLNAIWQSDIYIFEIMSYDIDSYTLKKIVNSYYEESE